MALKVVHSQSSWRDYERLKTFIDIDEWQIE